MPAEATAVVERYFACMRAGDVGVADLFHLDARLIGLGRIVAGRAAIAQFYAASIALARPQPRLLGPWLVDGERVAVELMIEIVNSDRAAAELGVDVPATPTMHVIDLFVVADGLIRSLTYFVADHP